MKKQKTDNAQLAIFSDNDFETSIEKEDKVMIDKDYLSDVHYDLTELFNRLAKSNFRSSFHLNAKDLVYINTKGIETIRKHAEDFVSKRLAPAFIPNDGKQTPMRGHPVFVAQHATACCCRGCFNKWHYIPQGRELTAEEQHYAVEVLMKWITDELSR